MLRQVLQEIEAAQGTISLTDLSRKLGLEPGALEGMIQFWVRKGRLKDDERDNQQLFAVCGGGSCGRSCPGAQGCPFVAKMPRTFSLALSDTDE